MRRTFTRLKVLLLSKLPVKLARLCFKPGTKPPDSGIHAIHQRQLLVDISVIINQDARTGIQRVVRALLLQLLEHPPAGWQVRPVIASHSHGYRYSPESLSNSNGKLPENLNANAVSVKEGDIFLGLDLAAHLLPKHKTELAQWKQAGVSIHIIVYDLLPVLHPYWFNRRTTRNFRRWLRTISIFADSIVCISETVKQELDVWLARHYSLPRGTIPISIIPLGADINASLPSRGLPENFDTLMAGISKMQTILMVGTIEPRKGHRQVLNAFERLWQQGRDINLVIVGKPGWKTAELQEALRTHAQSQKHLYWLDNASDELLELLYTECTGVLVASYAEGFGLPLIEAIHYNKPVLARDIPVFREIGGNIVTFFSTTNSESLSKRIENWLNVEGSTKLHRATPPRKTWFESSRLLFKSIHLVDCEGSSCPSQFRKI